MSIRCKTNSFVNNNNACDADVNSNLSSVGGSSLKLTDYYRAEARRYLPDRSSQDRGRNYEAEPRQ